MPLPKFSDDEQYLINSVKSSAAQGQTNPIMWGYIVGGILLAGFGAYHGSIPMMLAAFLIVCAFRVHEEMCHAKWMPVWRSIVTKYEGAAATDSDQMDQPDS